MKKKTTKKDNDFLGNLGDKIMKSHKLDGLIIIASKGNELNVDVSIPGKLTLRFLEALKQTNTSIIRSSMEHLLVTIDGKSKAKKK